MGRNITTRAKGGIALGATPPKLFSGQGLMPHYTEQVSSTGLTATRAYYIPIFIPYIETFAGLKTHNGNTGDNGEKYQNAIYDEADAGGPGSLLNNFGEITLDATSAERSAASSWTNTYIGWHYVMVHFESATNMEYMTTTNQPSSGMPSWQIAATPTDRNVFSYVDTAYGAPAATAVAPTAGETVAPAVMLYK